MSYFGMPRGRRKVIGQVRLVTDGVGVTTLYRDNISEGVVVYTTAAYLQIVSAVQNTQNINYIDIFCSEGYTGVIATGPIASETVLFYSTPGGNGQLNVRIDSGTRITIKPLTTPPINSECVINFFD